MGSLLSFIRSLADGEEETARNAYDSNSSYHQWQNRPTLSHQMECLTVTVPQLRRTSPSPPSSPAYPNIVKLKQPLIERHRRQRAEAQAAAECRWIKHYSSRHRILLVGEGDFSFSTCLAKAFGSASNIVATSLDSQEFLVKNYKTALSNLVELSVRKCSVIHEINATQMANHPLLAGVKFDRIVFNFPFAGFFKELQRDSQLRLHMTLVSGFLENGKRMLRENGEIHITHKTNGFHREWKVEALASLHQLRIVEAVEFNNMDYPGYNTKCGFGGDNNFNCNPCVTYKFRI